MEQKDIQKWSSVLNASRQKALPISQISAQFQNHKSPLDLNEAYQIQDSGLAWRLSQGEKFLGYKMGLTSAAKRKQMNLDSPVFGSLTDRMRVSELRSLNNLIHPRIEPEIAFWIQGQLSTNPSRAEVLAATAGVCAGLEIVDSRFVATQPFSLWDLIADNSSAAFFALGAWQRNFAQLDLLNLPMTLHWNNQPVQVSNSGEISGDPVQSVIQLCQMLGQQKRSLPASSLVLAGAPVAARPLEPNSVVRLEVSGLAPVELPVGAKIEDAREPTQKEAGKTEL